MSERSARWYLVRTKQYKESLVKNALSTGVSDTFLPLLRTRQRLWGRLTQTITPLFPCYLFALFDATTEYHFVRKTSGVIGVLCAGDEPSEVDESVIWEIKSRETDGIVELSEQSFTSGEPVSVVDGPLRGMNAVFERYLSGSERAALLIDLIGGANVRVILPSRLLASSEVRAS